MGVDVLRRLCALFLVKFKRFDRLYQFDYSLASSAKLIGRKGSRGVASVVSSSYDVS